MKIGELSVRSGASVRSLRYYEQQGLLRPERRPSGYREFSDADTERVARIRHLLDAGLSTDKIRLVLPCLEQHPDGQLSLTCQRLHDDLVGERDRMVAQIDALQQSVSALERLIRIGAQPAGR